MSLLNGLILLFLALKLTGEIQWSWWVVLIPVYAWLLGELVDRR